MGDHHVFGMIRRVKIAENFSGENNIDIIHIPAHIVLVDRKPDILALRGIDFCANQYFSPENAISTAGPSPACYLENLKGFPMTAGTVKWFDARKGFGFIAPDAGGSDAFVHISAVERAGLINLREGQKIGFELVTDSRSGKLSADKLQDLG